MYSTCLHCQKPLGANAAIEHLPIGRRVVFDGHKGRLWVVCGKCGRWNLVPFEDRWEALEECEKAYRGATQRASTGQIALARLSDGLELVRIGEPLRPEFSAWRYSVVLRARQRRFARGAVVATAAAGALVGGGIYLGIGTALGGAAFLTQAPVWMQHYQNFVRKVLTVREGGGGSRRLTGMQILGSMILKPEDGFPGLCVRPGTKHELTLTGTAARNALPGFMAVVNRYGAGKQALKNANLILETSGGAEGYLALADRLVPKWRPGGRRELTCILEGDRLALEMAVHEETERRALEGELEFLLDAWREAEELAGISDRLAIPTAVDAKLEELRGNPDLR
ncbi:MAG: hypothetical protein SGI84_12075 [Gemmatimonadota bacterium]|nr:hypothetical protein [Gemmatimonadota bacterium]